MGDASTSLNLKSFSFPLLCLLFYLILILLCAAGTVTLLLSTEVAPPPKPDFEDLSTVRIEGFSIPYYSKDGSPMMLVRGGSAILKADEAVDVVNPVFTCYSPKRRQDERIQLKAQTSIIDRKTGVALLQGQVCVAGFERTEGRWKQQWIMMGPKLILNRMDGTFNYSGDVLFSSASSKLKGRNLAGRFDIERAALAFFSFDRIYESTFSPELGKQ